MLPAWLPETRKESVQKCPDWIILSHVNLNIIQGQFFPVFTQFSVTVPLFPGTAFRLYVCLHGNNNMIFSDDPRDVASRYYTVDIALQKNDFQPLPYLHTNGRTYSRVVVVWRYLCRIRCFVLYPGVHPEFLNFKGVASVHQYEVLMRAIRKRKNSRETLIRIRMSRFFCCGVVCVPEILVRIKQESGRSRRGVGEKNTIPTTLMSKFYSRACARHQS